MNELELSNDEDGRRYLARIGEQIVGLIDYQLRPDEIVFVHTETDPAHQGKGIAGKLTSYALGDVRSRQLRLVPVCSYTTRFVAEHPEYADLTS
jgi:predicted GNAT family acetyltransferase